MVESAMPLAVWCLSLPVKCDTRSSSLEARDRCVLCAVCCCVLCTVHSRPYAVRCTPVVAEDRNKMAVSL